MIIQVGPYPPPIGGISMHIARLKDYMDGLGIINQVYDLSRIHKDVNSVHRMTLWEVPFRYMCCNRKMLIHYHVSGRRSREYLSVFNKLFFQRRSKVMTIHGDASDLYEKGSERAITWVLNTFDRIICVRSDVVDLLVSKGVKSPMSTIPAFIPPEVKKEDICAVPTLIREFMEEHGPLLTANAFTLKFHNGQDLYGFDMVIDALHDLKKTFPFIGCVFCLPSIGLTDYFSEMQARIERLGVKKHLMVVTYPLQYYPILMKSDVMLRPTNTDGDALSVRESLYFGVPSVASDVGPRPDGTILFKTRDQVDFVSKIQHVLLNLPQYRQAAQAVRPANNANRVLTLYRDLMSCT